MPAIVDEVVDNNQEQQKEQRGRVKRSSGATNKVSKCLAHFQRSNG